MPVVLFVIVILMTSLNDVTARSRRSDDANPLLTLVQQQAAALQRQEAALQALQNRVSDLDQSLQSSVSMLQHSMAAVSARVGSQVAFSVSYRSQHIINVGTGGTLKFDQVITNVGNGYTPHSGLFTAPHAGLYAFFFSLRSDNDHRWISLAIYTGSSRLVKITAEGSEDRWDRGTGFVTAHLNKGDDVYVRQDGGGTFLEAGPFTTFSGVLVSAD